MLANHHFSVLSLDRKYQRSRDEQRESPRSRQTAEIYARSCKAQCFTILLRLGLAEQSFFGQDLSRIVLYKQRRFEGGAALQDFQLFADSPRAHAPRSSHGLRSQPGEDLEVFLGLPKANSQAPKAPFCQKEVSFCQKEVSFCRKLCRKSENSGQRSENSDQRSEFTLCVLAALREILIRAC